jgi:hypothetical protein
MSSMSEDDGFDGDELERLRSLVGASEVSYRAALLDRAEAQRVARDAVAEVGTLRGEIVELGVEASRARQDQDSLASDRANAQRAAHEAAAEAHEAIVQVDLLQSEVAGLSTQLARALEDREVLLERAAMRPGRRLFDQLRGRWKTAVAPRLERLTGRPR